MSQADRAGSTNNNDLLKSIPLTDEQLMSKESEANREAAAWNRYAIRSRERQQERQKRAGSHLKSLRFFDRVRIYS